MLTALSIRDVVLIEALDLAPAAGLTALTGETGAGKSIVLDALGLATGARADSGLVRHGAAQASATASFAPPAGHPAYAYLADKGLDAQPGEDLVLRRQVSADGRSRAYVNDQATGVGVLRDLGALLLEVHGQHDTVGLLDPRTHRALLDGYGALRPQSRACAAAWTAWREAAAEAERLRAGAARADADREELTLRLAELDRLDPREGEEEELVGRRALLGGAEKSLADVADARKVLGGDRLSNNVSQALRALERARDRVVQAGAGADEPVLVRLTAAADAVDRTLTEALEALAAIDSAADAFDHEPVALERAEERLFALRAAARKLSLPVEGLPAARVRFAEALRAADTASDALAAADAAAVRGQAAYAAAAAALSAARSEAGGRLAAAVEAELAPLKLERARFRVAVEPLPPERAGRDGTDRVEFEVSTNPGAPFGGLGAIASGGELARFSLALKAALAGAAAGRGGEGAGGSGPVMIFDEVDQGVGGAVADAVGLRLKRLAGAGQVIVVTHSPQVAARADAQWRVSKRPRGADGALLTTVEVLAPADREEELARMLAGREITPAARAAARALMEA